MISSLWRGDWVQHNNDDNDIDYVQYEKAESDSWWAHLNPERMGVPRYQTLFRQATWIFFLFVYSQSVQRLVKATVFELDLYLLSSQSS